MGEETREFLEHVYASEYEEMRRLAYFKTGQQAHIVDPSQAAVETLVRAALKRDQLHGKTPAQRRAWLKSILVNEVLDALRRAECRLRSATSAAGENPLDRPTTATTPEELFERAERVTEMRGAMDRLSEKNREILVLIYRGDLSQELCADLLGMSYDAFRARLSHAKGKLRELLKHDL
jgi:RNA polymerase sigma-70 factor (ECF subfamily)